VKVLVANRGEIAVRVIRACRELGLSTVAIYSDCDRGARHVRDADQAVHVGPGPAVQSYLRIDRLNEAAKATGADAVHPGYGFLAENAAFARACADAGLTFIGPSPDAIKRMGSKTGAREIAIRAGVPVVPGTEAPLGDNASDDEILREGARIGFPLMVKAVAGGGGKGMRVVESADALLNAVRTARSEAGSAFGDTAVYFERRIMKPRHIEIQLLGDHHGHMIHLGERECSIQRRHQKVIEECPSPLMASHPELRERMGLAAVQVARAAGYTNAGTVEFLVDRDANFYFLEVNTRLQVEHPVTELVTGLDLVEWQLKIAAGERLSLQQADVTWRGSAIECRIYAEDPDHDFMPSPGRIQRLSEPAGPGVRLDSGIFEGWNVPLDYDPLLAKLAAWGATREAAIGRLDRALLEYVLTGLRTNIPFFREILADAAFREGRLSTSFLEHFFDRRKKTDVSPEAEAAAALVLAMEFRSTNVPVRENSSWRSSGLQDLLR